MTDGSHFENRKAPYLRIRLTEFDEIWYGDANWALKADEPSRFRIFTKMQECGGRRVGK